MLGMEVGLKHFNPFSISDCQVSYLLLIDNLLVVGYSSPPFAHSLDKILLDLTLYTGLIVNIDKSSNCFMGKSNHMKLFDDALKIKEVFPSNV